MAVKAVFALAALVALAIAMLLPVPGDRGSHAQTSQIDTVAVGKG